MTSWRVVSERYFTEERKHSKGRRKRQREGDGRVDRRWKKRLCDRSQAEWSSIGVRQRIPSGGPSTGSPWAENFPPLLLFTRLLPSLEAILVHPLSSFSLFFLIGWKWEEKKKVEEDSFHNKLSSHFWYLNEAPLRLDGQEPGGLSKFPFFFSSLLSFIPFPFHLLP